MAIFGKKRSYILQVINLDSPLDIRVDLAYPLCEEFRITDDKVRKEPILQALFYNEKTVKLYNKNLFRHLKDLIELLDLDDICISIDDVIIAIMLEIKRLYVEDYPNYIYNYINPPQRWYFINKNKRPIYLNDQLFKFLFEYINIDIECLNRYGSDKRFIRYELKKILYNLQEIYCRKGDKDNMQKNLKIFKEPIKGETINFYHEINLTEEDIKKEPIFQALFHNCYGFKTINYNLYNKLSSVLSNYHKEKFINLIKDDLNNLYVICSKYKVFISEYKYINKDIMTALLDYMNDKYQNGDLNFLLGQPSVHCHVPYFSSLIDKLQETYCSVKKEDNKMDKKEKNNIITSIRDALKECNIKNGNVTISIETENTEKLKFKIEEDSLKSLIESGRFSIEELKEKFDSSDYTSYNLKLNILINALYEYPEKIRTNNTGDCLYVPTTIDKFDVYVFMKSKLFLIVLKHAGYNNLEDNKIIPVLEDELQNRVIHLS